MHRGATERSVGIARSTLERSLNRWIKVMTKIVGFSILAIAIVCGTETNASIEPCRPGERMMKDCNTCVCIDGSGYACTRNVCVEGMSKVDTLKGPFRGSILKVLKDKRQTNPTEATCEPGRSFKHFCNDCLCGPDGLVRSAACIKLGCPEGIFNLDGSLKQLLTDRTPRDKRQANPTEAICEPGRSFKHFCNDCLCGPDGLVRSAVCTKLGCPEGIFNLDGSLNQLLTDRTPRDKRQTNPTEATCEPGRSFKHFCNDCLCGPDGLVRSAVCTKLGCPEGIFNLDGSLKQLLTDRTPRDKRQTNPTEAICEPGRSFKHFCNDCLCGPDGLVRSAACTKLGCPEGIFNLDGSLNQLLTDRTPRDKRQTNPTEATCEPGRSFKHFCNDCLCGPDGLVRSAVCTKLGCPEGIFNLDGSLKQLLTDRTPRDKRQTNPTEATCEPGRSFKHFCNDCLCGPDGLVRSAVCTKLGCPEGIFNLDGSLNQLLTDRTPRDKRQTNSTEATCEPGRSFKHFCNDCLCGPDGLVRSAVCTKLGCPEGIFNLDGSLKQLLTDPTPRDKRHSDGVGATCVPGTNFKRDCNTCYCPANGMRDSAFCTLIGCAVGVWNEDGSLKAPVSDPTPRGKRQAEGTGDTCVPGTYALHSNTICQCPANGVRDYARCVRFYKRVHL